MQHIAPAIRRIAKKHNIILRIISSASIKIPGINIEFKKWCLKTQYEEIRQFDIGIMPLSQNPFSKGKSSYKLLQYMSLGVPSVASAVGMNKKIGQNDNYCLLANKVDMFAEKLTLLLDDIQLRRDLGTKGRTLVQDKYSLNIVGQTFADILHASVLQCKNSNVK